MPIQPDGNGKRAKSRRRFIQVAGLTTVIVVPSVALSQTTNTGKMTSTARDEDRFQRGLKTLEQVGGSGYDNVAKSFNDIAPDLGRFIIEFAYGDIVSRSSVDIKTRELATVAALTALANAAVQQPLRYHINGALNVGATRQQVVEMMLHMLPYAGFPVAQNAITVAKEVFAQRPDAAQKETPASPSVNSGGLRYQRGMKALNQISKESGQNVVNSFRDIAPDLGRFIVEFSYGDIFSRPGLDLKTRELGTVAALTAMGTAAVQVPLKVHINGALNVGAKRTEVVEVILQMLVYAGFPATQNGINVAREVFKERDAKGQS